MHRLPSSDPMPSFLAVPPAASSDHLYDRHVDPRDPRAHQLLEDEWLRLSAQLDAVEADPVASARPGELFANLHACRQLLDRALRDCQFADQARVRQRADVLMNAALAQEVGEVPSAPEALREWRREMRALLATAVREGATGRVVNGAEDGAPTFIERALPEHLIGAMREQYAHWYALAMNGPELALDRPGHAPLREAAALLGPALPDLEDPGAMPQWRDKLSRIRALEDRAIDVARAPGHRASPVIEGLIDLRQLRESDADRAARRVAP